MFVLAILNCLLTFVPSLIQFLNDTFHVENVYENSFGERFVTEFQREKDGDRVTLSVLPFTTVNGLDKERQNDARFHIMTSEFDTLYTVLWLIRAENRL
jgi:hypothetical protein